MAKLISFCSVSLDGYFAARDGDVRWAHASRNDDEWNAFVAGNASGGGMLLFGRKTYEMMAGYWPSPMAQQNDPIVSNRMNGMAKVVYSRTIGTADWQNTRLCQTSLIKDVERLKQGPTDMAILGSGSIISQLASAGLIDEIQLVIVPVVLGDGRPLFRDLSNSIRLNLSSARAFNNGNVVLSYTPAIS